MQFNDILKDGYEIDLEIGNAEIDPYPFSIYVQYPNKKDILFDLYVQYEDDSKGRSSILSLDLCSESGLMEIVSLVSCNTIKKSTFDLGNEINTVYGLPIFYFNDNEKIIKSSDNDTEKQLFEEASIECYLDKNHFVLLFDKSNIKYKIVADNRISFLADNAKKFKGILLNLSEIEKERLKLWFDTITIKQTEET